ncbi:hypothetical protein CAP39_05900 [Sphingomonas sp. IBVSS1]|nr:hypothetical protein CAP39_05900 [Sphingomonas sp. IBVSS1]
MRASSLAVILSLLGSPCLAAADVTRVFTGTLAGGTTLRSLNIDMLGRGTTNIRVETDRPVTVLPIWSYEIDYHFICPPGVGDCGGNDLFFGGVGSSFTSDGTTVFKLNWRNAYRIGAKQYGFRDGHHTLDFTVPDGQPLTYRVTQSFHGQVPEPAAWLMLVAGFGLVGAAARRQEARWRV